MHLREDMDKTLEWNKYLRFKLYCIDSIWYFSTLNNIKLYCSKSNTISWHAWELKVAYVPRTLFLSIQESMRTCHRCSCHFRYSCSGCNQLIGSKSVRTLCELRETICLLQQILVLKDVDMPRSHFVYSHRLHVLFWELGIIE